MIATSFGLSFAVNVNAGTARCHHGIWRHLAGITFDSINNWMLSENNGANNKYNQETHAISLYIESKLNIYKKELKD
jgi:hypothetical protein